MTKTKFWLSILAISVVLLAGSIAVSPIAIAGDDDDDDELSPVSLDVIEVTDLVQGMDGAAAASATCPQDRVLVGGGGSYFTGGQVISFALLPDESIPNTFNSTVTTGRNVFHQAVAVAFCAKLIP